MDPLSPQKRFVVISDSQHGLDDATGSECVTTTRYFAYPGVNLLKVVCDIASYNERAMLVFREKLGDWLLNAQPGEILERDPGGFDGVIVCLAADIPVRQISIQIKTTIVGEICDGEPTLYTEPPQKTKGKKKPAVEDDDDDDDKEVSMT